MFGAELGIDYETNRDTLNRLLAIPEPLAVVHPPKANEVKIPSFSGEYLEYTAFRAAVLARVHGQAYPAHSKIDIIISACWQQ